MVFTATSVRAVSPPQRVLVLDVRGVDVEAAAVAPLSSLIASRIALHPGYDVASHDDVARLTELEAHKESLGCAQDVACLVEVSRKLNADLVVHGSVGRVGQTYVLTLSLLHANDLHGTRSASETVARVEELPRAVQPCLDKLFQWSASTVTTFHLPKGAKLSFAVFDLKPTGISAATAQNLTQVLSTEVKGIEGASVVSRDDIAAILQLQDTKQRVGCDDAGCMAEIGGALGVDRLLTGDAGKVGSLYIVNLRLLDVRRGIVDSRATESFSGDEEQLLRAVRKAARDLLGLSTSGKGQLNVTANQTASEVFLDDRSAGVTPLRVVDLGVGRHEVRVSQRGYFDWHGDVYVDPHETTALWAELSARPQAWYQKWWVWTVGGAAVAGGVVAAIVATRPPSKTGTGSVGFPLTGVTP
jgi:TolB-like protein